MFVVIVVIIAVRNPLGNSLVIVLAIVIGRMITSGCKWKNQWIYPIIYKGVIHCG